MERASPLCECGLGKGRGRGSPPPILSLAKKNTSWKESAEKTSSFLYLILIGLKLVGLHNKRDWILKT
jgi:hypothetical protein